MKTICLPGFNYFLPCLIAIFLLSGCEKKNIFQSPIEKNKEDYFDFATTKTIPVNINYAFQGLNNYRILFDLYTENPYEVDTNGVISKKDIDPFFRATTDTDGKFSDEIVCATWIDKVYLCTDYLAAASCVEIDVTASGIVFDASVITSKSTLTRATTPQNRKYPDDLLILGDWDTWGLPDYLLPEKATPPADLLYGIQKVLCGWVDIRKEHPGLIENGVRIHTNIRKTTKIKLAFLNSTATKRNAVGYYTYPTDTPPATVEEIGQKIIAFPHTSNYYNQKGKRFGALQFGDQIQLKYWNGTELVDEFPAGVSIGWFMIEMGYDVNTGNIYDKKKFLYSDPALNPDGYQRSIALYNSQKERDIIALGFEDAWNTSRGGNFGDALFYLDTDKDAIEPILPPIEGEDGPQDDENFTHYKGTLAFEDMWPQQGDYDMNDLVIRYESKVYKRIIGNQVFKIVDVFTPYNNGAVFTNGFGYQYHYADPSDIASVKIEAPVSSAYMQGQMLEPNQEHPTFILFDNSGQVVNKATFTVTTLFKNELGISRITPPYNPFLIVQANNSRGKEVHLVNYPPTSLADLTLLGTKDDRSNPEEELYYVSDNSFPFALNLPIANFVFPPENTRIDKEYPEFTDWVNSRNTTHKQWYNHKQKE